MGTDANLATYSNGPSMRSCVLIIGGVRSFRCSSAAVFDSEVFRGSILPDKPKVLTVPGGVKSVFSEVKFYNAISLVSVSSADSGCGGSWSENIFLWPERTLSFRPV